MVAETGSALAASERLRISQPSISYSLNQAETALGTRLFERTTSGSHLTDAGQILNMRAKRFFNQVYDALNDTVDAGEGRQDRAEVLSRKLTEVQVRALISIWRTGSFRAAAKSIGVSEPSLQRPARDFERLLRTNLFRRTTTGLEVNTTGAELARRLSVALGEIRYAIDEIGAEQKSPEPNLRVGVLALTPRGVIAETAIDLLASRPRHRVDVVEGSYESLVQALRSGDIDVVFGALRMTLAYCDLSEEPLFGDPYVLVCGASHPLAQEASVSPRQLAEFDFVFPPTGLPRREALDQLLALWKIDPKKCIETSCLATIVALLKGSQRISLLSRLHVGRSATSGLFSVQVEGYDYGQRLVGFTTRSQWLPTPFQSEFLRIMRRRTTELVAGVQGLECA